VRRGRFVLAALAALAALAIALGGCATPAPQPSNALAASAAPAAAASAPLDLRRLQLDAALEARILALDALQVSDSDVRQLLALGPTPRIVLLHGGIFPVHLLMESFARFLAGMGYPPHKLEHPGDGRLSHRPYENSLQIAGLLAWYYEHEGMMPLLIGHSQGGIQLVKVLYELTGGQGAVPVWNPITDAAEPRQAIVDPLSGQARPVVGLKVGYASVVGAGGAALLLPNQWSMARRLRQIPDSVDDFTGYTLALDLVAWDLPGAGNDYRPLGRAQVRNVELPIGYSHVFVPATSHLAGDPALRAWINAYAPGFVPELPGVAASTENSLWAADVWYQVKKHWVLEAQALLRARRALQAADLLQPAPPGEQPLRQP
jgi:hypothetical protein